MPIRFPCNHCNTPLSIARRKAGTSIDCPKCGHAQVVPPDDVANSAVLPPLEANEHDSHADTPEAIILAEGWAEPVEEPPPSAVQVNGDVPETSPESEAFRSEIEPSSQHLVSDFVLVSRRAIYLQGALIALVGIVGLSIGYSIGRAVAPNGMAGGEENAAAEQVVVEGRLVYRPADRIESDESAVAIFLPEHTKPAKRIETPGIRPADSPARSYTSLRSIRELGGEYAKADANGEFLVNLSKPGRYLVLLISANTRRPDGEAVARSDLETLDAYFRRPEYLVGEQKYRLTLEPLSGFAPIEHDFGLDRR